MPVTLNPRRTYRLLIGGAHYWGSWHNAMSMARSLARVTKQRIKVTLNRGQE
jgi:hypothetical protein